MAIISSRTANWRLFGGGGLIAGGLLWAIHAILVKLGVLALGPWLFVVALIVLAAGLVFVALGETGSNGAVGRWLLGKIALGAFAAGFLLVALVAVVELDSLVSKIAGVVLVLAGLASAYAVFRKRVARGAARWFLFVPVAASIPWVIGFFTPDTYPVWWVPLLVAVLLAATGALYLLNSRKIG